jgi:hypothetical protein
MFIIGLIVGIVFSSFMFILILGLCQSAARGEEQGELERLELEQQRIHKVVNRN